VTQPLRSASPRARPGAYLLALEPVQQRHSVPSAIIAPDLTAIRIDRPGDGPRGRPGATRDEEAARTVQHIAAIEATP
jgi:hypothetical protein